MRKQLRIRLREAMSVWRESPWTLTLLALGTIGLVFVPLGLAIHSTLSGSVVRRGNLWVCNLKTLSNFELDQIHGCNEDIPMEFRKLDGKRVELIGQMWLPYQANESVKNFDLVYSVASCCFSGAPKVQHIVRAHVREGATVRYVPGEVDVTGTLHVGVQSDGDAIDSVYRVDMDSVKPD